MEGSLDTFLETQTVPWPTSYSVLLRDRDLSEILDFQDTDGVIYSTKNLSEIRSGNRDIFSTKYWNLWQLLTFAADGRLGKKQKRIVDSVLNFYANHEELPQIVACIGTFSNADRLLPATMRYEFESVGNYPVNGHEEQGLQEVFKEDLPLGTPIYSSGIIDGDHEELVLSNVSCSVTMETLGKRYGISKSFVENVIPESSIDRRWNGDTYAVQARPLIVALLGSHNVPTGLALYEHCFYKPDFEHINTPKPL